MNPSVRVRESDSNGARGYIVEVSECRDTRLLDSFLMITENVLVMREGESAEKKKRILFV